MCSCPLGAGERAVGLFLLFGSYVIATELIDLAPKVGDDRRRQDDSGRKRERHGICFKRKSLHSESSNLNP